MPDAIHAKAERANRLFGLFDHAQLLDRHLGVIRNARREAGRRRLVPRRQPGVPRQLADLVLPEIHFVERAADAELARRLPARAIVAAIVGVVAVDDDRVPGRGDLREVRVQLVLAEIAAVGRIRPVFLSIDFVRLDDFVPQGEPLGDVDREAAMTVGIARAVGGDGDGAVPERRGWPRTPDTRCRRLRCRPR